MCDIHTMWTHCKQVVISSLSIDFHRTRDTLIKKGPVVKEEETEARCW